MISSIQNFDIMYKLSLHRFEQDVTSRMHVLEGKLRHSERTVTVAKKKMSNMVLLINDYKNKFAFLKQRNDFILGQRDQQINDLRSQIEFMQG